MSDDPDMKGQKAAWLRGEATTPLPEPAALRPGALDAPLERLAWAILQRCDELLVDQAELARRTNMSREAIAGIIDARSVAKAEHIQAIAAALDMDPMELFGAAAGAKGTSGGR